MRLPLFAPLDSMPGGPGDVTRADVIAEARSWLGTPYVHQHRAKGHAVDCVGLLIGVGRELGLLAADFDVPPYPRKPDGVSMMEGCHAFLDPVREDMARPGHILLVAFRKEPQHLGILADYLYGGFSLIHAYGSTDGKGRVEEWNLSSDRRAFKPRAVFSYRGVR